MPWLLQQLPRNTEDTYVCPQRWIAVEMADPWLKCVLFAAPLSLLYMQWPFVRFCKGLLFACFSENDVLTAVVKYPVASAWSP